MPYFRITKEFTTATITMRPGDRFIENIPFGSGLDASRWMEAVNRNNEANPRSVPYRVLSAVLVEPMRLEPTQFIPAGLSPQAKNA